MIENVCVFCGSSPEATESFMDSAYSLGRFMAENGLTTVYGGGGTGLMGRLANGALDHGGSVVGIIPPFMIESEKAHAGVTERIEVASMHERKAVMEKMADAFIVLPGGCGTFEQAFEMITWRRLAIHNKPICVANLWNYYDPLTDLFKNGMRDRLMDTEHLELFAVRESIEAVQAWLASYSKKGFSGQ